MLKLHSVRHKSDMDWPGSELWPSRRDADTTNSYAPMKYSIKNFCYSTVTLDTVAILTQPLASTLPLQPPRFSSFFCVHGNRYNISATVSQIYSSEYQKFCRLLNGYFKTLEVLFIQQMCYREYAYMRTLLRKRGFQGGSMIELNFH